MTKQYINRTCHHCGVKHPQPEMYSVETIKEVGRSSKNITNKTVLGYMLGNKQSSRALSSWLFDTSNRKYTKKVTYWICEDCYQCKYVNDNKSNNFLKYLFLIGIIAIGYYVYH